MSLRSFFETGSAASLRKKRTVLRVLVLMMNDVLRSIFNQPWCNTATPVLILGTPELLNSHVVAPRGLCSDRLSKTVFIDDMMLLGSE
jgi:hypothetical protein